MVDCSERSHGTSAATQRYEGYPSLILQGEPIRFLRGSRCRPAPLAPHVALLCKRLLFVRRFVRRVNEPGLIRLVLEQVLAKTSRERVDIDPIPWCVVLDFPKQRVAAAM